MRKPGHIECLAAIAVMSVGAASAANRIWTGPSSGGLLMDGANYEGGGAISETDTAVFNDGNSYSVIADTTNGVVFTLAAVSVSGGSSLLLAFPAYAFTNTISSVSASNADPEKSSTLTLAGGIFYNNSLNVGTAATAYNNRIVLFDCYAKPSGNSTVNIGATGSSNSNNWLCADNGSCGVGNITYARGSFNGVVVTNQFYITSRLGIVAGAKVLLGPGAVYTTGGSGLVLGYSSSGGSLFATNAALNGTWSFSGNACTSVVVGSSDRFVPNSAGATRSDCFVRASACTNGTGQGGLFLSNSDVQIDDSIFTGGQWYVGGTNSCFRFNACVITNTFGTLGASGGADVFLTNCAVIIKNTDGRYALYMQNTSTDDEAVLSASGTTIINTMANAPFGIGTDWGSGSYRNNTCVLSDGSLAISANYRIAEGGQGQRVFNAGYTNNWLVVESGSQLGKTPGEDGKPTARASLSIGGNENGLVARDTGTVVRVTGSVYTNDVLRIERGATLDTGTLNFYGGVFEVAGDDRGDTTFASGTTVTFTGASVFAFEPDSSSFTPVALSKIASTADSNNRVRISASGISRQGGCRYLPLATYDTNENVAFELDTANSSPAGIGLTVTPTNIWAKIPGPTGTAVMIR